MNAYKSFLNAFVERYDGDGIADAPGSPVVRHWQIANEPDYINPYGEKSEWNDTPQNYAYFLKESALSIRSADPSAKVMPGGLARGRTGLRQFFEPVFDTLDSYGGGPYFDVFDIHWFGLSSNNRYFDIGVVVDDLKSRLSAHGYGDLPIWVTETATYAGKPEGWPLQTGVDQARDLAKRLIHFRRLGVEKIFWATLTEFHHFNEIVNGYFDHTGLINNPRNEDGKSGKKKGYFTYQLLVDKLDGAVVVPDSPFMQMLDSSAFLKGCEFVNFDRNYYALWIDDAQYVGTQVSFPTGYQSVTVHNLVETNSQTVEIVGGNFVWTLGIDPILIEYAGDGPPVEILSPDHGILTSLANVNVDGVTDPLVDVLLEGPYGSLPQTENADSNGAFSYNGVPLAEGSNALTFTVGSGTSLRSKTLRVLVDTIPPDIIVLFPEQGSAINTSVVSVVGLTELGQTVVFENPPSGSPLTAVGGEVDITFNFPEQTFPAGLNTIQLSAEDVAGNLNEVSVDFVVDTQKPAVTDVTVLQSTQDETGPYAVYARVSDNDELFIVELAYTINSGPLTPVPMAYQGGGIFRGEIPGQPSGTSITYFVRARDRAGNWKRVPSPADPVKFQVFEGLSIDVTPRSTTIRRGESLQVDISMTNPTASSQTASLTAIAKLPNGTEMTLSNTNITLSAGQTKVQTLTHTVPSNAPLGTYLYSAILSTTGGFELTRDEFNFQVTD